MPTTSTSIIQNISKYFPTAERAFLIALFAGILLAKFQGTSSLLIISILALSTVYFLMAFFPSAIALPENEKLGFGSLFAFTIAPKVVNIGNSVLLMGLLYMLIGLKGGENLLIIGLFSSFIATTAIAIALVVIGQGRELWSLVLRSSVLVAIGLYTLFTNVEVTF